MPHFFIRNMWNLGFIRWFWRVRKVGSHQNAPIWEFFCTVIWYLGTICDMPIVALFPTFEFLSEKNSCENEWILWFSGVFWSLFRSCYIQLNQIKTSGLMELCCSCFIFDTWQSGIYYSFFLYGGNELIAIFCMGVRTKYDIH